MAVLSAFLYAVGLITCSFYKGCDVKAEDNKRVSVEVNTSGIIAQTSDRFLSLGFSPYLLRDNFSHFDIRCPRIKTLLAGLAPTVLRLGGTKAESLTFHATDSHGEQISKKRLCRSRGILEENAQVHNYTITGTEWDAVNQLALASGARVAFGFSAIKRKNGKWDSSNALALLNYTMRQKYAKNIDFELGNEPNSYNFVFGLNLTAEEHGRDFLTLHQILRDVMPYKEYFKDSLIIGPDMTQPDKERKLKYAASFLSVAGQILDRFSWHHYYVSSKDPSTSIKSFTDPAILDSLELEISAISKVLQVAGFDDKRMWTGECSSASGGGVPNASDRYVAGFMWLDRLGVSARAGIQVVIRWSFISGHYSLLDEEFYPFPDYWLSWIYKALVGTRVLNVTCSDSQRKVRMYSHCTKPSRYYTQGAITLYGMNLYTHDVTLDLPPSLDNLEKHVYLLTPHGSEGLRSRYVDLNSVKLQMVNDVTLPDLKPLVLNPGSKVKLSGQTFGFIVIPQANVKCCIEENISLIGL